MRSNSACSTGTDFSPAGGQQNPTAGAAQKGTQKSVPTLRAQISAIIAQHPTEKTDWEKTMRAMGLVLLSIAIMALLLTDADAQRRSSAQGSQAAGAKGSWCATYPSQGLNDNCSYSSFNQCYQTAVLGRGGFCRPNPVPGSAYGTGYTWSGPKR